MVVKNSTNQTITQYNVQTGDALNSLNQVSPSTANFVLTSNGLAAQPSFQAVSASGAVTKFAVDTDSGAGTNPVLPDATGKITVTGGQAASGTTANAIETSSLNANAYSIIVQRSGDFAASDVTKNGVSHFASADFTVDGNGFVQLANPAVSFMSGTWTPILYGLSSAGTTTYNVQNGTYVQFGNLVWVRMYLQVATATGTGNAVIDGLPFTIYNNSASFTNSNLGVGSWTWPVGSFAPIFYGITGTTTGWMAMNGSGITTQYMQVQNGIGSFAFNMVYQVSA
jgi:hypothetical protein